MRQFRAVVGKEWADAKRGMETLEPSESFPEGELHGFRVAGPLWYTHRRIQWEPRT